MKSGKVDAADIFAVLKEARDAELGDDEQEEVAKADAIADDPDAIGKADFARLFKSLDLHFTDAQFERLFAMTDLDGNGNVTLQEFEGAWDVLSRSSSRVGARDGPLRRADRAVHPHRLPRAPPPSRVPRCYSSRMDAGGRLLWSAAASRRGRSAAASTRCESAAGVVGQPGGARGIWLMCSWARRRPRRRSGGRGSRASPSAENRVRSAARFVDRVEGARE